MSLQAYNTLTTGLAGSVVCLSNKVMATSVTDMSSVSLRERFYSSEVLDCVGVRAVEGGVAGVAAALPSTIYDAFKVVKLSSTTAFLTYEAQAALESAAFHIFEEEKGRGIDFVSVSYVAGKCDRDISIIAGVLERSPRFRRTYMKSKTGHDVYMLESRFAFFKNVWKSFLHLNALKS